MPSAIVKAAYMRVAPKTYRRAMETQVDVDKVEPHNLEDKVLAFIGNNTSGAAPLDIGNIAPGQTPAPRLGSSNQSTTSSSHGGPVLQLRKVRSVGQVLFLKKTEWQKERERRETTKVGMTVKFGQPERDGQKVKVGIRQVKVGSNKGHHE